MKNFFNNVQITVLLAKQYKFFHRLKALSHYNVLLQRVPTCEKFVQHVNVRWIRFKNVFYKFEGRLNTQVYANTR